MPRWLQRIVFYVLVAAWFYVAAHARDVADFILDLAG